MNTILSFTHRAGANYSGQGPSGSAADPAESQIDPERTWRSTHQNNQNQKCRSCDRNQPCPSCTLFFLGFDFSETWESSPMVWMWFETRRAFTHRMNPQPIMSKLYRVNRINVQFVHSVTGRIKSKAFFCGIYDVDRLCNTYGLILHMLRNIFHAVNKYKPSARHQALGYRTNAREQRSARPNALPHVSFSLDSLFVWLSVVVLSGGVRL